jgi:hypothetical protein
MYPQPPEDYTEEEKRCWESLNHPHGEEFPGQYDYEREVLDRRNSDYDKSPFSK